jgi:pimeloyl-ACP methyl ester carboxylesterase
MKKVISKDGASSLYDQLGKGPAVILACGGSVDRTSNAPLAALLAKHFTVLNYDRRGRGDSGDTPPYAVEREVDATIMGDYSLPAERIAAINVPTIVIDGGASFPFLRATADAIAKILPKGQRHTLEGQTHNVAPEAIAPILTEFFSR